MDYYNGNIPIIDTDDPSHRDHLFPKHVSYGCIPRDYSVQPATIFAAPSDIKVIPESDWDAYYDEQEASKSSLEHNFLPGSQPAFVNLDQDGFGYCWAHSTTQAMMLTRLYMGLDKVRLSAFAVAAKIKGFKDEGGWGALSAKFATDTGIPSCDVWPEQAMDRKLDNAATWADAAKNKITTQYVDLTRDVYDQNLTKQQLATCLFLNMSGPVDFNWWSHSVAAVRWVRIEKGNWGLLILNSWKGWGRFGLGVLKGSQSIPDGALAIRATTIN